MDTNLVEPKGTIELTYAYHLVEGTQYICGRHLAEQLVEDAVALLVPPCGGNAMAAWDAVIRMAGVAARKLDDELTAGKLPGLLLRIEKPSDGLGQGRN